MDVQGSSGESSEFFIIRLCKRAGSFLRQRIPMVLQISNAACVLETVSERDAFEEIDHIEFF